MSKTNIGARRVPAKIHNLKKQPISSALRSPKDLPIWIRSVSKTPPMETAWNLIPRCFNMAEALRNKSCPFNLKATEHSHNENVPNMSNSALAMRLRSKRLSRYRSQSNGYLTQMLLRY